MTISELSKRLEKIISGIDADIQRDPALKAMFDEVVEKLGTFRALCDREEESGGDLLSLRTLWIIAAHPVPGEDMTGGVLAGLASIKDRLGCTTQQTLDFAVSNLEDEIRSCRKASGGFGPAAQ